MTDDATLRAWKQRALMAEGRIEALEHDAEQWRDAFIELAGGEV